MTIRKAITTVLICTLLGAALGGGGGYALGKFAPGYYRTVFPRASLEPGLDPVHVGLGLGLSQWTPVGGLIGLAVVALLCWRDIRTHRAASSPEEPSHPVHLHQTLARWIWRFFCWLLVVGFCLYVGFICGIQIGHYGTSEGICEEQFVAMEKVLRSDPAFAGVEINYQYNDYQVTLAGSVKTQADLARLREKLTPEIGRTRAEYATKSILIR